MVDSTASHWKAYILLTVTSLCWGLNTLFGKLAVGHVSPMLLVALRWICVVTLIVVFMRKQVIKDWPILRDRLWFLMIMGALGYTGFNTLFYLAAHHTTALNMGILQGSMPVIVLLGAYLAYRTHIGVLQIIGVMITLVGVVFVTSGGSWTTLKSIAFNHGDVLMMLACILYAGYAVGLQRRPAVSPVSVFAILAFAALLSALPLLGYEIATGQVLWPTLQGWIVVLLVALLPSFVSQLFFMQGVSLIGPGRAGVFVNLVPVFGALFAVFILGEAFRWFHGLALVMVLGGIAVAELGRDQTKA